MSNKSQLQLNNADLQSILSTVLGLPTQESMKHGAYVWKKYEQSIHTATLSVTSIKPLTIKLTSDIAFEAGDMIGQTIKLYTGSSSLTFLFISTSKIKGTDSSGSISEMNWTFDAVTQTINTSADFIGSYTYELPTVSKIINDFIDFVVSDNESAYPDGGMQDGYWYEKVVDELPIGLMTDYAIDKFTVSAATTAMDIPHSLGKLPRAVILVKDSYPTTTTDTLVYLLGVTDGTVTNMYYYYRARQNTESTYTGGNSHFTASDKKLSYNISYRYLEGSYTLLTMA